MNRGDRDTQYGDRGRDTRREYRHERGSRFSYSSSGRKRSRSRSRSRDRDQEESPKDSSRLTWPNRDKRDRELPDGEESRRGVKRAADKDSTEFNDYEITTLESFILKEDDAEGETDADTLHDVDEEERLSLERHKRWARHRSLSAPEASTAAVDVQAEAAEKNEEKPEEGMSPSRLLGGMAIGRRAGADAAGGPTVSLDMFSDTPEVAAATSAATTTAAPKPRAIRHEAAQIQSDRDDAEGYFLPRIGETVGGRYLVQGVMGKGVFSSVLKCLDAKPGTSHSTSGDRSESSRSSSSVSRDTITCRSLGAEEGYVAIKVIRNNEAMRKAAAVELNILKAINAADPHDERFCIRLLGQLDHLGHTALIFPLFSANLRETLKKFGRGVGINVEAVRMYGRQLLVALKLLSDLRVVHSDIKLDNILCSSDLKVVKICDFGSAFSEDDSSPNATPYLVSRFYRAPEVILGLPHPDRSLDLWAVAVCLFELYTGNVMYPGRNNNEMLRLMLRSKGRLPNKIVKQHIRGHKAMNLEAHFEESALRFKCYEMSASGQKVCRSEDIPELPREEHCIGSMLRGKSESPRSSSKGSAKPKPTDTTDDGRLVQLLESLLNKCLVLDRSKRITVDEALAHGFFAK